MKLRDTLNRLKCVFIGRSDKSSELANAIKQEFGLDFIRFGIFYDVACDSDYDIAIVDIDSTNDLYILDEMSYVNPNLYYIIISNNNTDFFILRCFKFRTFAFMQKDSIKAESSSVPAYKLRSLEVVLGHFSLLKKSYSNITLSSRITIQYLKKSIYLDNKEIFLSPKLKTIFWLLFENHNRVVPYSHILSIAFNEESNIDALRMSIVRIKKLLQNNDIIANISGEGYMLVI